MQTVSRRGAKHAKKVFATLAPLRGIVATFLLCLLSLKGFSQDLHYAHRIVNTLASPAMHGRGYVNNGCNMAGDYLKHQFDSLHLQSFNNNYFQNFSFPVNTFPFDVELTINGKALIAGKDYIVEAPSGKGKGDYGGITASNHYNHSKEEVAGYLYYCHKNRKDIVFDYDSLTRDDAKFLQALKQTELPKEERPPAVFIIENKKLTMDVSEKEFSYPVFTVLRSALPASGGAGISDLSFKVSPKLIKDFKTHNIIGYIRGSQYPDSFIVYTAHYDHLGQMGKDVYFPGANDNASGIAMLLNLASYYDKKENQPACSIAFIAFAGEEAGLLGSKYFSEHPLFPLSEMKFLINLDLLGTGDEGMMVVNATTFPKQFALLDSINNAKHYLIKIGQRGKAANSDHYWFTEEGVPSFYFYTLGGIAAYHDIYDKPETLPLTAFDNVFLLIVDFTSALQKDSAE
jgi:hypothetical protein